MNGKRLGQNERKTIHGSILMETMLWIILFFTVVVAFSKFYFRGLHDFRTTVQSQNRILRS